MVRRANRHGHAKENERRIVDKVPAALMKRIRRSRALVAAELPELAEKGQRLHDAKSERTTSGALRRAIHKSKLLLPDLADLAEIDMETLDAFLTGTRPLTSDVNDRLAKVLKLKLEPDRPRTRTRPAKAG